MDMDKRKILVTVYFDNEDHLELDERDYDRFILETDENNFTTRVSQLFEDKGYAWNDSQKTRQGYKDIMIVETSDLTELKTFDEKYFIGLEKTTAFSEKLDEIYREEFGDEEDEDEWEMEM